MANKEAYFKTTSYQVLLILGGTQLVEALRYKSEVRGFDFLQVQWIFQLT
jgi:hypothetical protein